MRTASVHRFPQSSPDDVSALERAVTDGKVDPKSIVAILGKTEGNGCVNDFTRAFAVQCLQLWLRKHLKDEDAVQRVCYVMSGGTEGALTPHVIVLEVRGGDDGDDEDEESNAKESSLAIGVAHTAILPSWQLGRTHQVDMVAEGVREAMKNAGIAAPNHVHFVQIKCPLLTAARVQAAESDGWKTTTTDTLNSMKLSRGASALGVAVALGELQMEDITDDAIGKDWSLFSSKASTSGGVELLNHEIVVLGMSSQWKGPLAIDHAVMKDALDVEPIRDALIRLGVTAERQLTGSEQDRIVCLLCKAEASSTGTVRGKRHVMLDDSDISATRHARGFVAGVVAGLIGHTEIFVSGGAEHQGPDGGGPVAIVVKSSSW